MREPLWLWQQHFDGGVLPPNVVKPILQMTLTGLDYLHSECRVVHGGTLQINIISSVANITQT
jgi:serine/threonine protein kinase